MNNQRLSLDYENTQNNDVVSSVREKMFPCCESCESERISFVKENRNNKDISVLCLDCQTISIIKFPTIPQKKEFVLFLKERDEIRRNKEWERKYDEERGRATPLINPPAKGWANSW